MKRSVPESWINTILLELHNHEDVSCRSIIEECGRNCCKDSDMLKDAKMISERIADLDFDEKFAVLKKEFSSDNMNFYKEDDTIYIEYSTCICHLKDENGKYDEFMCKCTCGYIKEFIENFMHAEAEPVLLESINKGGDRCLLAVKIKTYLQAEHCEI